MLRVILSVYLDYYPTQNYLLAFVTVMHCVISVLQAILLYIILSISSNNCI